jgi:cytochrome oxidase Cu insertion factor (SCO1/SenC/PrrC family)
MHPTSVAPGMLGLAVCLIAVAGVATQPPETKAGLKAGTKAPAFRLKDQAGKERSLEEFLKKGTVALVFYRSASW